MTTEIAIMNASGIALAADSALTVSKDGGTLHYHGIDKIFGLSALDPVAIMVHGRPEFMDIPWDIIIKSFRDEVNVRRLPSLSDYGNEFLRHLRKFCSLHVSEDREQLAMDEYIRSFVCEVRDSGIDSLYKIAKKEGLTECDESVKKLEPHFDPAISQQLDMLASILKKRRSMAVNGSNFETQIMKKYS